MISMNYTYHFISPSSICIYIYIKTRNDGHLDRIISTKFCRSQFCYRESKSLNLEEILLIQLSLKQNLKKETHEIRGKFGGNPLTKASFGVILAEVTIICLAWSGPRIHLQRHNFANILGCSTVSSYSTPHHVRHPTKARNNLQNLHPHSNHLKYPKDSSPILPHPTSIPPNKSIHPLQHVELPPRKRPISSCQRFGASDKIVWDEIRFPSCLYSLTVFWGCVLKFCFGTTKGIIFLWSSGRNFGMEVSLSRNAGSLRGTWRFSFRDYSSLNVETRSSPTGPRTWNINLIYICLFPLDDSKSSHRKSSLHRFHPFKIDFAERVPRSFVTEFRNESRPFLWIAQKKHETLLPRIRCISSIYLDTPWKWLVNWCC